ncbi:hypothetical protein QM637_22115 [Pantoea allii]|uniref:hypothetical protein n=1 Tax=Pantoea allii TaxID=574096 RepID=UPI0024B706AA|nr:hypothetical protein [Pantoea allii]MDJ0038509.1 hypothetical protein [Pantoea allii]MDJ0088772.1 hypothetical protein [Pantoea allii]
MNKKEMAYIKELKNDDSAYSYQDDELGLIRMKIIYRGERLYLQVEGRAMICVISARDSMLSKKSLIKWDSGDKINLNEVDFLCEKIKKYYAKSYSEELVVV